MIFILSSIFSCVNCPAVICLPNTILSYGETPLVNCRPRSFSLLLLYNLLFSCFPVFLLQTILFPFDTINPLFSARPVRLTTSLSSWGKVIWLCCAGLYFNLGVILVSFWFDNLGFTLREILAAVYITTFLLGFSNFTEHQALKNFWHHCRGTNFLINLVLRRHQEFLAPLPGRQSDTY